MTQIQGLLFFYVATAVFVAIVFAFTLSCGKTLLSQIVTRWHLCSLKRLLFFILFLVVLYVVPVVAPSQQLILEASADIDGAN